MSNANNTNNNNDKSTGRRQFIHTPAAAAMHSPRRAQALTEAQRAAAAAAKAADLEKNARAERDAVKITALNSDLEAIRAHVSRLEDLLRQRDQAVVVALQERDALNDECDSIAAQCRLLEQACRLGARKALRIS